MEFEDTISILIETCFINSRFLVELFDNSEFTNQTIFCESSLMVQKPLNAGLQAFSILGQKLLITCFDF